MLAGAKTFCCLAQVFLQNITALAFPTTLCLLHSGCKSKKNRGISPLRPPRLFSPTGNGPDNPVLVFLGFVCHQVSEVKI